MSDMILDIQRADNGTPDGIIHLLVQSSKNPGVSLFLTDEQFEQLSRSLMEFASRA